MGTFTQFLDQFLILVELFECLNVHMWDVGSLGFITMLLVTKNTHRELGTRSGLQPVKDKGTNLLMPQRAAHTHKLCNAERESYPYRGGWSRVPKAQS